MIRVGLWTNDKGFGRVGWQDDDTVWVFQIYPERWETYDGNYENEPIDWYQYQGADILGADGTGWIWTRSGAQVARGQLPRTRWDDCCERGLAVIMELSL